MGKKVLILSLTRYGDLGASSRMRFLQYVLTLKDANIDAEVRELFDNATLAMRYQHGGYGLGAALRSFGRRIAQLRQRHNFDLLWIEKEALPWWPLWCEAALLQGVPYVLDYDDAVFHSYDQHRSPAVRFFWGRRLDGLMANAALVVAGNEYLAERARSAGAPWIEVLPTVVDLARYPVPDAAEAVKNTQAPVLVWIGSPSTVRYLELLWEPLLRLAERLPFVLRVIGGELALPGVQIQCLPWTEDTEVGHIRSADLGVMPLLDSPWERGKCGYKLIQYMACGLPVVASPVGVNVDIVKNGENGFLAGTSQQWESALERLIVDATLRVRMGAIGRRKVEQSYCLQATAPRLAGWLRKAAQKG